MQQYSLLLRIIIVGKESELYFEEMIFITVKESVLAAYSIRPMDLEY